MLVLYLPILSLILCSLFPLGFTKIVLSKLLFILGVQWPFLSMRRYLILMTYLSFFNPPTPFSFYFQKKAIKINACLWLKIQAISRHTKQEVKDPIILYSRVNHCYVLVSCFQTFLYLYTNKPLLFLLKDKWTGPARWQSGTCTCSTSVAWGLLVQNLGTGLHTAHRAMLWWHPTEKH